VVKGDKNTMMKGIRKGRGGWWCWARLMGRGTAGPLKAKNSRPLDATNHGRNPPASILLLFLPFFPY